MGPAAVERPHPLAERSARISFDSWCEQWGRGEPSEVLGDERERRGYSDQDYVQSHSLRPLAHPFQPFFFGLDTFSRALSPERGGRRLPMLRRASVGSPSGRDREVTPLIILQGLH